MQSIEMSPRTTMRGTDFQQEGMFSYVSPESRIPQAHPLRPIRTMVDAALKGLSRRFDAMYSQVGRPSIPPEKLLRALLLQVFYSVRSERLLMEQLDYNLLFRWFVGMSVDEPVWDHSTFTKNRERLIEAKVARKLLRRAACRERRPGPLSNGHVTGEGTPMGGRPAGKGMLWPG